MSALVCTLLRCALWARAQLIGDLNRLFELRFKLTQRRLKRRDLGAERSARVRLPDHLAHVRERLEPSLELSHALLEEVGVYERRLTKLGEALRAHVLEGDVGVLCSHGGEGERTAQHAGDHAADHARDPVKIMGVVNV